MTEHTLALMALLRKNVRIDRSQSIDLFLEPIGSLNLSCTAPSLFHEPDHLSDVTLCSIRSVSIEKLFQMLCYSHKASTCSSHALFFLFYRSFISSERLLDFIIASYAMFFHSITFPLLTLPLTNQFTPPLTSP